MHQKTQLQQIKFNFLILLSVCLYSCKTIKRYSYGDIVNAKIANQTIDSIQLLKNFSISNRNTIIDLSNFWSKKFVVTYGQLNIIAFTDDFVVINLSYSSKDWSYLIASGKFWYFPLKPGCYLFVYNRENNELLHKIYLKHCYETISLTNEVLLIKENYYSNVINSYKLLSTTAHSTHSATKVFTLREPQGKNN